MRKGKNMAVKITKSSFGKYPDGRDVTLYTMENDSGLTVAVTDLGAAVVRVIVPDKKGNSADVVLALKER